MDQRPNNWRITLAAALVVLPWGLQAQTNTTPVATATKPALSVKLYTVQGQNLAVQVSANGSIAPWQDMSVGSLTSGLRVKSVTAEVGQTVKKGQVLARLEDDTVQADLAMAKASLAEAQASLDDARATADMVRKLDAPGALSQQQINQTFATEKLAEARVQSAQAMVKQQQVRLSNTVLVAPDDGVVSSRTITVGRIANPGEEFYRVIRQGRLEWRAELSEQDLQRVKVGQKAEVDFGGQVFEGKVRAVPPGLDLQSRMALALIDLPNSAGPLKAGTYVKGRIVIGQQQALSVPQTALVERDGFSYVFKVDPANSRTQRVKVKVGSRQGSQAEVLQGLQAGDRIVASGVAFLADGDLVKVLP